LKAKGQSAVDKQKQTIDRLMAVRNAHSSYGLNRQKVQAGDYENYLDVVTATAEGPLPTVIKTKLKLLTKSNRWAPRGSLFMFA
jgi:hypothetical protein